jgi:hypothetical protein
VVRQAHGRGQVWAERTPVYINRPHYTNSTHFDAEHGVSAFPRNVGNTAHFHAMPQPKPIIPAHHGTCILEKERNLSNFVLLDFLLMLMECEFNYRVT